MNKNEKSKEAEEKEPNTVIPIWEGEYVKLSVAEREEEMIAEEVEDYYGLPDVLLEEEHGVIEQLRKRFPNNYPGHVLQGGNWYQETYAPTFKLSMNGREEMPNILKLSTPYGRLKSIAETAAIISEIEEGRVKKRR